MSIAICYFASSWRKSLLVYRKCIYEAPILLFILSRAINDRFTWSYRCIIRSQPEMAIFIVGIDLPCFLSGVRFGASGRWLEPWWRLSSGKAGWFCTGKRRRAIKQHSFCPWKVIYSSGNCTQGQMHKRMEIITALRRRKKDKLCLMSTSILSYTCSSWTPCTTMEKNRERGRGGGGGGGERERKELFPI